MYIKINASMRMGNERQKVTNWQAFCIFLFLFCYYHYFFHFFFSIHSFIWSHLYLILVLWIYIDVRERAGAFVFFFYSGKVFGNVLSMFGILLKITIGKSKWKTKTAKWIWTKENNNHESNNIIIIKITKNMADIFAVVKLRFSWMHISL